MDMRYDWINVLATAATQRQMIVHALLAICNCSFANRLSFVVSP